MVARERSEPEGMTIRHSLTDEEWAVSLGAAPDLQLSEFLAACGEVKYGATAPTHWATRERAQRARELAEGLARTSAEAVR